MKICELNYLNKKYTYIAVTSLNELIVKFGNNKVRVVPIYFCKNIHKEEKVISYFKDLEIIIILGNNLI